MKQTHRNRCCSLHRKLFRDLIERRGRPKPEHRSVIKFRGHFPTLFVGTACTAYRKHDYAYILQYPLLEATVWENGLGRMDVTKVPDRRVACRPGSSSLDAVFTIGGARR